MFKVTAAAAMIGLMAFAAAGCGGGDKKEVAKKRGSEDGRYQFRR